MAEQKEEVNKTPEKEQPKVEDTSNDKIRVKKSKMKKFKTSDLEATADDPVTVDLSVPVKNESEPDVIKVDTTEKTTREKSQKLTTERGATTPFHRATTRTGSFAPYLRTGEEPARRQSAEPSDMKYLRG